ncbi:hypothetical protein ACOMHN_050914 [Nucella lapillus]
MDILGLLDIPLWLILMLGLCLLLYIYGSWNHSTWTSQGVPGPKPWPLLGNTHEMRKLTFFRVFGLWKQKYGAIVGYYNGVRPTLMVMDLDFVKEVMVKQFSNFTHRNFSRGMRPKRVERALFFAGGSTWKRIRNLMTPSFSASKLKLMTHYVNRCSDLLVKNIENKARTGQLIGVKEVFGGFTMDVITGTAFGLKTNSQTQEGSPFTEQCKKLFASVNSSKRLINLLQIINAFPFLGPLLGRFGFGRDTDFFFNSLESLVEERREGANSTKKKSVDMFQLLLDAEADPEQITDSTDNMDDAKSNRRMTKDEIVSQGFIVLIAGFETTSTTLQYLTYHMALYPDIQEKVFEEIQKELGDVELTYENVTKLKYLEACIRETLRMFPPVAVVDRKAQKAVTIRGIHIPAEGGVTIPVHAIMHDPEFFPDPEVFNPDRYLEENASRIHPVTEELPFGYGPRKCIGMRLAMLEMKFAASRIFRHFRFVKCAETPEKINLGGVPGLPVPDKVIKVKAEIRQA